MNFIQASAYFCILTHRQALTWNRLFRGCRVLSLSLTYDQHQRLSHNQYWDRSTLLCKLRVCKKMFFFSCFVFSCCYVLFDVCVSVFTSISGFLFQFLQSVTLIHVLVCCSRLLCVSVRIFFSVGFELKKNMMFYRADRERNVIWYHGNNVNI